MNQKHEFDVIIIGRGITGTSAAWHLSQLGYKNVLVLGPDRIAGACASQCPGFVTASTIDNITRIVHGHGSELAGAILKLGQHGYEGLRKFALSHNVPWAEGSVRRFAPTEHEKNEMVLATEMLKQLGLDAKLLASRAKVDPNNTVAVQNDGILSAVTDIHQIMMLLETQSFATIDRSLAKQVLVDGKKVVVKTEDDHFESEMVLIAAHLQTGELIPNLKEALVSYADQWISFEAAESLTPLHPGNLWIGHHGHYGLWRGYDNRVYMTGARFLRHWAGIEAKSADVLDKITTHLVQKGEEWFGFKNIRGIQAHGILDCRPCDELPVIGPMFGQNRLLVGTGYMGSGLALGFAAGEALASLVHKGQASQLHPGLTPTRLRSLT